MIYVQGGGKQTHYVLSTANSSTINIGGLPADPTSVNDTFAATDVGDIIRVIVRNLSTLQDYETTIVAVNSPTQAVVAQAPTITSTDGEAYWFPASEDDTATLQAAINSGVGTIQQGKGVLLVSEPITNVRNTTKILGEGSWRSTVLLRTSDTQDSFDFTDVMGLNLEGFSVVGPGMDSIYSGGMNFSYSDFSNTERLFVRDVYLRHLGFTGFVVNTPILSTFIDDKVEFGAGDGFDIFGGTTTDLINCYGITLDGPGFLIADGAYMIGIQGGATESAGVGALVLDSTSVTLDHLDSESEIDRTPVTPSAAPTLALASGGSLATGVYYMKFAWMHGTAYGVQSAESTAITTTSGNQTIVANLGTVPAAVYRARIYMTVAGGGSGNEGFLEDVTVVPGTTGTYRRSANFTTVGSGPPDFWYNGHGYVVAGSTHVSNSNSHSRDIPDTISRHFLVTDNSNEVTITHPDIVQGLTMPAYDIELTAGSTNNELVTALSPTRILNSATNTLIRNGLLSNAWGSALWTPFNGNNPIPSPPALFDQFTNTQPVQIVRISASAGVGGSGGTKGTQFQVTDGTNNCNTGQDMLPTNSRFSSDVPTGTCSFAALQTLSLRVIADDHTTLPGVVTFTVEMVNQ